MRISGKIVLLGLLAGTFTPVRAQVKIGIPTARATHEKIVLVNLCELAEQMKSHPDSRNGLEIETQKGQAIQMADHSDIVLSFKKKDQVRFSCSQGEAKLPFRIDRFAKAQMSSHPDEKILSGAPDSPFSHAHTAKLAEKSNTPRLSGPPEKEAIHQRYKFTFTVFQSEQDSKGTQYDPHLIIEP